MKHNFLIFIFLVFCFNLFSKNIHLTIKDNTKSLDSIWVLTSGEDFSDVQLKTRIAEINLPIREMDKISITGFKKGNQVLHHDFWISGDNVKIDITKAKKKYSFSITGSPIEQEFQNYIKEINSLQMPDFEFLYYFLYKKIKEHKEDIFSSVFIEQLLTYYPNDKQKHIEIYNLIKNQSPIVKNHFLMESIHKNLEFIYNNIPLNLREIDLYNIRGEKDSINLKTYSEEKLLILDFWFTDCPPCIKDHKTIREFQKSEIANNIKIIGISTDDKLKDWQTYLKSNKINWLNYMEEQDAEETYTEKLGISSYPTYFIINTKGEIMAKSHSFIGIKTMIPALLDLQKWK